jgi:hypothetical protein
MGDSAEEARGDLFAALAARGPFRAGTTAAGKYCVRWNGRLVREFDRQEDAEREARDLNEGAKEYHA